MPTNEPGIHHVTAIAGDPQQNIDFYTQVLGLRLVKKTVNHDDPSTYHLSFGDDAGHPGTNFTFFSWPNGRSGQIGTGQDQTTAFLIPLDAIDYWTNRFDEHDVVWDAEPDQPLPDRYIEGTCPYCGATARGDECENCGHHLEA